MFSLRHHQLLLRLPHLPSHCPRFASSDDRRASTIKTVNYTNKALYGKVSDKATGAPSPGDAASAAIDTVQSRNDRSSEMYWLLQHKPPPKTHKNHAQAPKRRASKLRVDCAADEAMLATVRPVKTARKRTKVYAVSASKTIPASLSRFGDTLCKPPVKTVNRPPPVKSLAALVAPPAAKVLRHSAADSLRRMLSVPPFGVDGHPIAGADGKVMGCTERLDVVGMPSVGKVLQATMPDASRRALMHWKELKIAELGEEGFRQLQQSHLSAGSQFHAALQTYFHTKQAPEPKSPMSGLWSSVAAALVNVHDEPELIEAPIVHPVLQYKGIVDCVSSVNDELAVIEWKKSDRHKTTLSATFDAPLQLCAYLGAINADPRYQMQVRSGLVVIAYTTGAPAHAFRLNETAVRQYWQAWLRRLHEYWERRRNGTLPEPI